jgi:uncharacterized protein
MKIRTFTLALLLTLNLSALTLGETPKNVTISGDDGGYVEDGSMWDSSTIKDKVYVMFYVDPDEKDVNEHYSDKLKEKNYSKKGDFGSIAVINLAATWKPNFIIEKILKSKQEKFPNTIYVKDKNRVLVNEWGVGDDASNIIIFAQDGRVLFYKSGRMSDEDMEKSFKIIEENL